MRTTLWWSKLHLLTPKDCSFLFSQKKKKRMNLQYQKTQFTPATKSSPVQNDKNSMQQNPDLHCNHVRLPNFPLAQLLDTCYNKNPTTTTDNPPLPFPKSHHLLSENIIHPTRESSPTQSRITTQHYQLVHYLNC